ncbi:MAG: DUF4190 domain-containing protein [Actinomycetota bacterium]
MELGGKLLCRTCVSMGAGIVRTKPAGAPTVKPAGPSGVAITAFVLSIVGFFFCITGIPGFVMGLSELKKINRGESPVAGRGFALAAAIIGGIMTGLIALIVLFYIVAIIIAIATS